MNNKAHFLHTEEGKKFLQERYVNNGESAYVLAKELDTHTNKIYRALKKHNLPRRSKQEAQKLALQTGTAKHPVAGKPRPMSVKNKIGQKMHDYWQTMGEKELEKRVDKCREIWYSLSEEKRKEMQKKSNVGLRKAANEGSRFEKTLLAGLIAAGFKCEVHKKCLWEDYKCSIDIYLPIEGIAIEVNGPSHFLPLFGEEALRRTIERDLTKIEHLIANGYSVISIQNQKGYSSKVVMDNFVKHFIPYLKNVCKQDKNNYYEILVEEIYDRTPTAKAKTMGNSDS